MDKATLEKALELACADRGGCPNRREYGYWSNPSGLCDTCTADDFEGNAAVCWRLYLIEQAEGGNG